MSGTANMASIPCRSRHRLTSLPDRTFRRSIWSETAQSWLRPNPPLFAAKADPDRRVVARLLPAADMPVDLGVRHPSCELRAQQQMVDPESRIAGIGIPEIIPEGIDRLIRVAGAQ